MKRDLHGSCCSRIAGPLAGPRLHLTRSLLWTLPLKAVSGRKCAAEGLKRNGSRRRTDRARPGWTSIGTAAWICLIVNGSTMDDLRQIVRGVVPPVREGSLYLYRNLGNGQFEDVTARSRLANPYWGTGVAVADYDNDGYPDILVTNIGVDLLFHNNHDGTFTEVGKEMGLSRKVAWHTGAAFGDYDNDGKLDLYVAGYVDLNALHFDAQAPVCDYRGVAGFCGPLGLKGEGRHSVPQRRPGRFHRRDQQSGRPGQKPEPRLHSGLRRFQPGRQDRYLRGE